MSKPGTLRIEDVREVLRHKGGAAHVLLAHALSIQAGEMPTVQDLARWSGYSPQLVSRVVVENSLEVAGELSPNKTSIPDALRWDVWERDNFTCQTCGSRRFLSIDHILPERLGGQTVIENLQTLCNVCNGQKGGRL